MLLKAVLIAVMPSAVVITLRPLGMQGNTNIGKASSKWTD
jgi:hypothetical protein